MTGLPTGTVTYFFSDIEGSTKLLQRLGRDYRHVLDRHGAIIRSGLTDRGGIELSTEGDSFFGVFVTAPEAVDAAATIQQDLAEADWPDGGAVRVRIGLHTGRAELGGANYVGLDVHRAARIAAAGHGGQVVVSEATRVLAGDHAYLDLGSHRLKDLEQPEHLYQLLIEGLPSAFPPLRAVDAHPNNLPTIATQLLGRQGELAEIRRLLVEHRLVTVVGLGGVGKTRLAIQAAADVLGDFEGGVFLVPLAAVADPSLVVPAIAAELGIDDGTVGSIAEGMGSGRRLLLLDNLEQVIRAAPTIGELLGAVPSITILATSQVPLRITSERVFLLEPLGVGEADNRVSPAAELFAARAAAVDPGFSLEQHADEVARLVAALDGLPLALELAAARVNVLTPGQILERMGAGSDLLVARAADAPQRHRSLQDAIAWSHDLLTTDQREILRALAIFAGGATLGAVEAVTGRDVIDHLAELVDRSLVRSRTGVSSKRFDLLDSLRAFVTDQLEPSEAVELRELHTGYFVRLASSASDQLTGERVAWWLAALGDDHENLQAALGRLLAAGDTDRGFEMLGSTWRYFQGTGRLGEVALWLERFFQLGDHPPPSPALAKALMARGAVAYWRSDFDDAADEYRAAIAVAESVGDPKLRADAYFGLATSLGNRGELEGSQTALDAARRLYEDLGDTSGLAGVAAAEAFYVSYVEGALAAVEPWSRAVAFWEASGQPTLAAQTNLAIAGAAVLDGNYEEAKRIARHSLDLAEQVGDRFVAAWAVEWVATALVAAGELDTGALLAGAAAAARERMGGGWTPLSMDIEDAATRATAAMGAVEAQAAMARGADLTLDQAIEIARGT